MIGWNTFGNGFSTVIWKKLQKKSKLILPLGGDSDAGSESDDDTRLLEEGTVTLPVGTGKLWTISGKWKLRKKISLHRYWAACCMPYVNNDQKKPQNAMWCWLSLHSCGSLRDLNEWGSKYLLLVSLHSLSINLFTRTGTNKVIFSNMELLMLTSVVSFLMTWHGYPSETLGKSLNCFCSAYNLQICHYFKFCNCLFYKKMVWTQE